MNVDRVRDKTVVRTLRFILSAEGANHSRVAMVHLRHSTCKEIG